MDSNCCNGQSCQSGFTCVANVCTPPVGYCTIRSDCPADTACTTYSCGADHLCHASYPTTSCGTQSCPPGASGSCTRYCSGGSCQSCTPTCIETNCNDGGDNDADGLTDCADPNCDSAINCLCQHMTCNSPPNSLCYITPGACSSGICTYTPRPDGYSCGTGQICSSGTCVCASSCTIGLNQCSGSNVQLCQSGACTSWVTQYACGTNSYCASGSCSCTSPYLNCDSQWSNGCEANRNTNNDHCGDCSTACGSHSSCASGQCACNAGYADCNANPSDGCEAALNTADHCGDCNTRCGLQSACSAGNCVCNSGYADCNSNPSDGCEAALNTVNHCGSCGRACSAGQACVSGNCVSCTMSSQCISDNPCETGICNVGTGTCSFTSRTSGSCGTNKVCNAASQCVCSATTTDCSGVCSNLLSDPSNCGSCSHACPANSICSNSACSCSNGDWQQCGPAKEEGICKFGTKTCSNYAWGVCTGAVMPTIQKCNGLDNDCDGALDYIENPSLCSCDSLKTYFHSSGASIAYPLNDEKHAAGSAIPFASSGGANIDSYKWEFGDNSYSEDRNPSHAYSSTGTFTINLLSFYHGCSEKDSIQLNIVGCVRDMDCGDNQQCIGGSCAGSPAANQTNTSANVQEVVINILSPKEQVSYAQKQVPLSFEVSPASAQCSYTLNGKNSLSLPRTTATLNAIEGQNTLTLKCADKQASKIFMVKLDTKPPSIFDNLDGNASGIFDSLKDEDEMKVNATQIEGLFNDMLKTDSFEITRTSRVSNGNSLVILNLRNLLGLTLRDTKVRVTIPKSIAKSADDIRSQGNFTVIERDPMLEFSFPEIKDDASIVFEVAGAVGDALLKEIDVEPLVNRSELYKKQNETQNAARLTLTTQEYEKDGQKYTKITTKIKPTRGLTDMSVIERIPKCLAKHINDITIDEKYRDAIKVINADPIVMWHFKEITSEQEFSYDIKGELDEDCKKQIEAMGIADELGLEIAAPDYLKIILPLLLIPLLGILIIYFEKFRPQPKGKEEPGRKSAGPEKPVEKAAGSGEETGRKAHMILEAKQKNADKFFKREIKEAEKEFRKGMR